MPARKLVPFSFSFSFRNYSSMDIPFGSEANLIKVELHISDVLKINDRDFSITFSLYFNVQWLEPRINLNPSFFQNRSEMQDIIYENDFGRFWDFGSWI